jgi:large repetitive protein
MFLSRNRSAAKNRSAKSERRLRRTATLYRQPALEMLESRLAPAGILTLPASGYAGDVANPILAYPINVTTLNDGSGHTGLASVTLAVSFPRGVFNFPIGGNQASVDVNLGSIPLSDTVDRGGAADWNLTANSNADGNLLINLSAKAGDQLASTAGGSLVTINFPILFDPQTPTAEAVTVVSAIATTHTSMVGTNGTYVSTALGLPATGSVTVNPGPALPPVISTPQNYTTESNTPLNQAAPGLLAGGSDPDGLPFAVNAINGAAYIPGTPLTLPSGASLTVNLDGSFTYVPVNFVGTDTFTFTAADSNALPSNTGTVTFTMMPTLSLVPEGLATGSTGATITEDVVLDNPKPTSGTGLASFDVVLTVYQQTIRATGGTGPYTFAVGSGALPPGLTLDSSTGERAISPTPQQVRCPPV